MATSISANGASQYVSLRMNGSLVEYSTDQSSWTPIATTANWPVTITNTNPGASSILRVVFTQNLTISNTYGNTSGYFIAGSTYITFDGSNNFINITNIPNYLGLIQNGSTATLTNGYANVIVQNIKANVTGTSTLSTAANARAGWICASSFGRGAAANQIINCTNNGGVLALCGGICGERAGVAGGNVTMTNCQNTGNITGATGGGGGVVGYRAGESGTFYMSGCTNSGSISGLGAGGIAGQQAGQTNTGPGSATFVNCTNNGAISGQNAGGIVGSLTGAGGGLVILTNCVNSGAISGQAAGGAAGLQCGSTGSATITNCTNSGPISGTFAGGIAGSQAGSSGSITFTGCTNSGTITSGIQAGGIAGPFAGQSGLATFTNCTNTGLISASSAGGIAGANAGQAGLASFTKCTNSGVISGTSIGGIAGAQAGISGSATFTNCFSTGDINSLATNAGGITGENAGSTNGLVTLTNCFSTGAVSGQYAGGIAGNRFGFDTSINCVISQCYSTGDISGNNAGGIVGAIVGYTDISSCTPNVNITNCYSLGAIATSAGGICGGTNGSLYAVNPNITITNCYSSGTIVDASSGIVAIGLPIPTTKTNTYIANNNWTDASANALIALTGTPTGVGLANKGTTWTSISANIPYLLTSFFSITNPTQIYTPNSVSSFTNYTSAAASYSPGIYSIQSSTQSGATITVNVAAIAGTSPKYYGYYNNIYTLTNLNGGSGRPITASINASNGVLDFILPYPCFLEGTKILCFENDQEVYRPIESLRKGDLVKTIYNGYMPIHMIGTSYLYNPGNDYRVANRLYKCSREKYPELFEDLYITGCHSILVPSMSDDEWENTKAVNGDILVTDNHFRLIACADEKAEPFNKEGFMNIYHIALEHNDYYMNYGIYANGLLVESCSKRYLTEISNMRILGEEDCSVSENVDKVPFNIMRQLVDTY